MPKIRSKKKVCKNKNAKKSMKKKEAKVGVAMCSDWSSEASSESSSLSDIMCSQYMFKDDKLQNASYISKECIINKKDAEKMRNGFKFDCLIRAIMGKHRNNKIRQIGNKILDHLKNEIIKVNKPNRVIFALMTFNTRKKSILDKMVKEVDDDVNILIDKYNVKASDAVQLLVKNSEFKKSNSFKKLICSFIHYYLLSDQENLSKSDIKSIKKECPEIKFFEKKVASTKSKKTQKIMVPDYPNSVKKQMIAERNKAKTTTRYERKKSRSQSNSPRSQSQRSASQKQRSASQKQKSASQSQSKKSASQKQRSASSYRGFNSDQYSGFNSSSQQEYTA